MRRTPLAVACVATLVLAGVTPSDAANEVRGSGSYGHIRTRTYRPPRPPRHVDLTPGHAMPVLQGIKAPTPKPVAPVPAAASYSGGCLSSTQVASYAAGAGFPSSVIPTMVAIAYRESHLCPGAVNRSSGACGLWQIYPAQPGCLNPATNAALAYEKYAASGLAPWGG